METSSEGVCIKQNTTIDNTSNISPEDINTLFGILYSANMYSEFLTEMNTLYIKLRDIVDNVGVHDPTLSTQYRKLSLNRLLQQISKDSSFTKFMFTKRTPTFLKSFNELLIRRTITTFVQSSITPTTHVVHDCTLHKQHLSMHQEWIHQE